MIETNYHMCSDLFPIYCKITLEKLENLDNALGLFSESYLVLFGGSVIFTKSGLKDLFWQVVRFGGLGVIIGWLLKSVVS